MHGIKFEQIADYNLCTHVAQRLRALVLISHHGTHRCALLQQQFSDGTSYATDPTCGAGNQCEISHCLAFLTQSSYSRILENAVINSMLSVSSINEKTRQHSPRPQ